VIAVMRLDEVNGKLEQVREFLARTGLGGMVLSTRANFAWLTGGGSSFVGLDAESGIARLVVTPDGQHVLTDNIEVRRLQDEELDRLPFEMDTGRWDEYDPAAVALGMIKGRAGSDVPLAGAEDVGASFARLRWRLCAAEIERYREVAAAASRALAETAREIEPGMTEHEIAGRLMGRVFALGAQPGVALVAADERAYSYRHPIPTDRRLERHVMIVMGAIKYGLGVYATRMVHFGEPSAELRDKHAACCLVDACFNLETRPGASVGAIFRRAVEVYAGGGYPDEWRLHHQGGATGYAAREYKGTCASTEIVIEDQAFAWNPSIAGTKSEDTILARADGPEFLSVPVGWPTLEVTYEGTTLRRPDILVR
jgi:Xaa-Pro aminopeptidase